jgi:hypothetical protein
MLASVSTGPPFGNLWQYVTSEDSGIDWCVLRGGSFRNDRTEVRSYLRLIRVPLWHRPPDFGFRLAQVNVLPSTS